MESLLVVHFSVVPKTLILLAIGLGLAAILLRCVQGCILRGSGVDRAGSVGSDYSSATRLALAYVTGELSTDQHGLRAGQAQETTGRTIEDSSRGETCCTPLAALLPNWPISDLLIATLDELHALNEGMSHAQRADVSEQRLDGLRADVHATALLLGRQIDAIAAIAAMNVQSEELRSVLEQHGVRIERIGTVIHEAREGLALLALKRADDDDSARIEQGFRIFTEVARDELA